MERYSIDNHTEGAFASSVPRINGEKLSAVKSVVFESFLCVNFQWEVLFAHRLSSPHPQKKAVWCVGTTVTPQQHLHSSSERAVESKVENCVLNTVALGR